MAQGNRNFLAGLLPAEADAKMAKLPPRTGMLENRGNRLAQLADGQSVARMHELVDPARCAIWEGHNRDYAALDQTNCADLIESFQAQGRQEVPAIVRRLRGDPNYDFQVICGARRRWTATWMRANGFPSFAFLVEPRELSDEEAFRVADLENRSRRDLSDVERARDYARAITRYYDGNQNRMAERLQVTKTWLSRYLELARLPELVLAAFGSPHVIGISHGASLAPLLRDERVRSRVLAEAQSLATAQQARREACEPFFPASAVVQRLERATREGPQTKRAAKVIEHVVRAENGLIIARGSKATRGGALVISLPNAARSTHEDLVRACKEIIVQFKGH